MLIPALAIPFYSTCLLLVAFYTLFRLKSVDTAAKLLCAWVWLMLFKEVAAWYTMSCYKNNLPVYNLSGLIEFGLIALYFHFSVFRPLQRPTAIVVATTGFILGLGSLIGSPLVTLNTNFLFLECVITICLCLYALYYRLIRPDTRPSGDFHFLASGIFLAYKCCTLWVWWTYSQSDPHPAGEAQLWNAGALLTGTLAYLSMGWILFFYSNFRKTHV